MTMGFGEFCDTWNDIFEENTLMTRWIRKISERHRVYILSNTNQIHYEYMKKKYSFWRYVTGEVISNHVGFRKPDARFFRHALKMCKTQPAQVFYLDDVWGHAAGARRCGIQAYRYVNFWIARREWERFLARV